MLLSLGCSTFYRRLRNYKYFLGTFGDKSTAKPRLSSFCIRRTDYPILFLVKKQAYANSKLIQINS